MENLRVGSVVESKLTGMYYEVREVKGNIYNLSEIGDRTLEELNDNFVIADLELLIELGLAI